MSMEKKEAFKILIKEFHESEIPTFFDRTKRIDFNNKITTLVGPRRSGKTFYFYQLMKSLKVDKKKIIYINFEDDRLLPIGLHDLNFILEAYYEMYPENKNNEIFVFFDEIQNVENWEVYVRRIYDKEKVRLFVTGSNSKLLSREIATSLRGRTLTYNIFPLDFKEFLSFKGIKYEKDILYSKSRFKIKKLFLEYLSMGGFPEVVMEENNLEMKILEDYFDLILYKDIVERFNIRNLIFLKMLSKYLFTNVSNLFSINKYYNVIKKDMSIGKETIIEYLSYLQESGMIYLLSFFSYSLKQQQINPKKVYCVDNGLRNAISFKFSEDIGRLAENLVFVELKRKGKEFFYWKNKKGQEIDFVIKNKDKSLSCVNVSYANKIHEREINGLLEFKKEFEQCKDLIILTKDLEKEEKFGRIKIRFIPIYKFMLEEIL